MLRIAALIALVSAVLLAGGAQAEQSAPDLRLKETRANSCGSTNFKPTLGAKGEIDAYTHEKIGLTARTQVGDAMLEWCQSAQNAVIYFYVDNPSGSQHKDCSENMSVALFPGQGAQSRSIIDSNVESYFDPAVRLVEAPKTGPVEIHAGNRDVSAYQLEGVIIDPAGQPRRHRMIGYARGDDFVRVMTGTVDTPNCRNETAKAFLAKLTWP